MEGTNQANQAATEGGGAQAAAPEQAKERVVYGRGQDAAEKEAAGAENPKTDLDAEYRALIQGKYKDAYDKDVRALTERQEQALQEAAQYRPIMDTLAQRYHIEDGDIAKIAKALDADDAWLSDEAERHGMTLDQYRELRQLRQQNANLLHRQQEQERELRGRQQVDEWVREAESLKGRPDAPGEYPELDLAAEMKDRQFVAALDALTRAGFRDPLRRAYESVHMDDIKKRSAESAERRVIGNIQARGTRPAESAGASAVTVKSDVRKLTRADRVEIAKRVMRGETISF